MAASSLLRLFIVVLILIALALSSGIAWGSFSLVDDRQEQTTETVQNAELPSWPFGSESDSQ